MHQCRCFILLLISVLSMEGAYESCSEYGEYCVDIQICYKNDARVQQYGWILQNMKHWKICGRAENSFAPKICCKTKLNAEDCGVLGGGNRIANGKAAEPFQFPWMVLLRDEKYNEFICSGTLITPRFVLSAAHCVTDKTNISVRVGENDISKKEDCIKLDNFVDCAPEAMDIPVDLIKSHEKYSARYKQFDIAVLRLEKPAELGRSVRTICLATQTSNEEVLNQLTVAGWGLNEHNKKSNILQYGALEYLPIDDCTKIAQEHYEIPSVSYDIQICTHSAKNKINTCAGDSGGPLMVNWERTVQYAVIAHGIKNCGKENLPTLFTKVIPFMDWIFAVVEGN